MSASALAAVLGFGREVITAHFYGTRSELDAYLNASAIPVILFGILNGSLVAALVPVLSEYASGGRDKDVQALGSIVVNLLLIVLVVLTIAGWFFAPYMVSVIAHGFPTAKQVLEVRMVRWLMPGIFATSLSGVFTALLNTSGRFLASSFVAVAANLVTMTFILSFHTNLGIFALVLGSVLGLFAQLLVQLPTIARERFYTLRFDLRHPGLQKVWALFIPVTLGGGAWQINLAFDRYFASTLNAGSTAALGYTTKLAYLPAPIVAGAISTVIFPLIADQFASSNFTGMRHSISLALRMVSFIVIPCAAGLSVLAYPIVKALFERGAFDSTATRFCSDLLPFGCITLLGICYSSVMQKACYACKEMHLTVTSTIFVVAINVILSYALLPILGARGLLLANGAAMLFGTGFQTFTLWRLTGGLDWKSLTRSIMRTAVAALIMSLFLYIAQSASIITSSTAPLRAAFLGALILFGVIVYVGMTWILGVEELFLVGNIVRRRAFNRTRVIDKTKFP